MTDPRPALADGYPQMPLDEAVDHSGRIRPDYVDILGTLDALGAAGVQERVSGMNAQRKSAGIVFTATVGGESTEQVFPLDPVPRLIGAPTWAHLSAGAKQRALALNAFLADVYGAEGQAQIVADGIVPDHLVRGGPGYREAARLFPSEAPRATVHGLDLLTDVDGRWVVLEDNLEVPSGLGYATANRRSLLSAFPEWTDAPGRSSPDAVPVMLRTALADAAPSRCEGEPSIAILSDGATNSAWYEHQLLADEMGVPVVHPDRLRLVGDRLVGDVGDVGGESGDGPVRIDVLYRRRTSDELLDGAVGEMLRAAAAAGTIGIANAPGNGVADDKAIYAFVGPMIRYYLDEEPILADVGTWVLADPDQYEAVRGRLGDLVCKPVDGFGGQGVSIGPEMSAAEIAELEKRIEADPARWIAQDVVRFSTHPTLIGESLRPRHVDLRMFVLSGRETVVPPVGLTRVALGAEGLLVNSSQGGGSKDTWLPT